MFSWADSANAPERQRILVMIFFKLKIIEVGVVEIAI